MNEETLKNILDSIECRPYTLRYGPLGDGWFIQAQEVLVCIESGLDELQSGGKLYVSPHCEKGELVRKCFAACVAFAEHEVRESFTYDGERVFGPHINVDALWDIADATVGRS